MYVVPMTHIQGVLTLSLLSAFVFSAGGVLAIALGVWGFASKRWRIRVCVGLGVVGILDVGIAVMTIYVVFVRRLFGVFE